MSSRDPGWDVPLKLFQNRLTIAAASVERRLAHWLGTPTVAEQPPRLKAAMQHGALGGGKRFRAFLVVETATLFGAAAEPALEVAAALECVHAYSLVHDDLPAMDNDRLRRGRPTVWAAFDDWTAILAGDALLTLAFEIVADAEGISERAKVELVSRLARQAGRIGMVGGQVIDLEAEKLGKPDMPTAAHIRQLQAMKTGALIAFACEAGAVLGDATPEQRGALVDFARHLGLAFQISDDLLDEEGDAAVVGKAVRKDASHGKATLVSLLGMHAAKDLLQREVELAIAAVEPFGPAAEALRGAALFMLSRNA